LTIFINYIEYTTIKQEASLLDYFQLGASAAPNRCHSRFSFSCSQLVTLFKRNTDCYCSAPLSCSLPLLAIPYYSPFDAQN